METSGWLYPQEKALYIHWIRGWVGAGTTTIHVQ